MTSSPNEPNEHNRPFRLLDFVAIWLCADMLTSGVIGVLIGAAGAWLPLLLGMITWWLYEGYVKRQIQEGHR